jgi:hypothetical protein
MPVADITRHGDVLTFLRLNRDSRAFSTDQWFFVHIPKTAGSSLREEIANVIQPDLNIEVNYKALDTQDWFKDFDQKIAERIREITSSENFPYYRFFSGHIKYRDIAQHKEFNSARLIAMLRAPKERLKSDYRYQISEDNPLHASVLEKYPTFQEFYRDPVNHDIMFKYLCQEYDQDVNEAIRFVEDRFTFVGVQEMYPISIRLLFALFGMRAQPQLRLRESSSRAESEEMKKSVDQIAEANTQEIENLNSKDFKLYDYFRDKLSEQTNDIWPLFDRNVIFQKMIGMA